MNVTTSVVELLQSRCLSRDLFLLENEAQDPIHSKCHKSVDGAAVALPFARNGDNRYGYDGNCDRGGDNDRNDSKSNEQSRKLNERLVENATRVAFLLVQSFVDFYENYPDSDRAQIEQHLETLQLDDFFITMKQNSDEKQAFSVDSSSSSRSTAREAGRVVASLNANEP